MPSATLALPNRGTPTLHTLLGQILLLPIFSLPSLLASFPGRLWARRQTFPLQRCGSRLCNPVMGKVALRTTMQGFNASARHAVAAYEDIVASPVAGRPLDRAIVDREECVRR